MIVDKKYLDGLRKDMLSYALKRREIISKTGDALHYAKRAIFAIHRDDIKEAEIKLKEAESILLELNKKFKNDSRLIGEGSYKAGLEEYVEATLFYQFLTIGKIGRIKSFPISSEIYVAGLCDVPGELQRYAIKSATANDIVMVKKCAEAATEIIGELIEFNLTSYLRTKFDQAKSSVQRLEQVVYEMSLKNK